MAATVAADKLVRELARAAVAVLARVHEAVALVAAVPTVCAMPAMLCEADTRFCVVAPITAARLRGGRDEQ